MKKNTKNELWKMRSNKAEKEKISRLAKHLGMKQAQAVRYAVDMALKTAIPRRNSPPTPQAAMTA